MLWKELYFDRARSTGRIGQILTWLLIIVALGGSAALIGYMEWHRWYRPQADLGQVRDQVAVVVDWSSYLSSWMLQWTIGLSASLIVAAEREGGTWEALLLSPLNGGEIVRAKILGTLYGIRWVLFAMAAAYSTAAIYGAASFEDLSVFVASLLAVGVFMASAGVWFSLSSHSVTRALTFTVGCWLMAAVATMLGSLLLVCVGALMLLIIWQFAEMTHLVPAGGGLPSPLTFSMAWQLGQYLLYVVAATLIAVHARRNFDRLAGRAVKKHIIRHPRPGRRPAPGPAPVSPPPPGPPSPPARPRGAPGSRRGRPGGRWQHLD